MQDFADFKALVEGVIRRARTILADDGKLQPAWVVYGFAGKIPASQEVPHE